MSARKRAIARARAAAFMADKGPGPASKREAKAGKVLRKHYKKMQYLTGGYFHDPAPVLGYCDARMRVLTPPATARPTGKMLGWVEKGISRRMNKLTISHQLTDKQLLAINKPLVNN